MENRIKENSYGPGTLATYAVLAVAIAASAFFGEYSPSKRETRAIKDNKCHWEEVVAKNNSSYRGYAVDAIRESKDLGARVGVDRVSEILSEKNDDREVVAGESYNIYRCSNK